MKLPRTVDKPWGRELIWAETPQYAAKILTIEPGCCLSLQFHRKKTETIYVLSGRAMVEYRDGAIDRDDVTGAVPVFNVTDSGELDFTGFREGELRQVVLEPGQSFHVPCNTVHRFSALETRVELAEVSTPELDDVVRLSDRYGRT